MADPGRVPGAVVGPEHGEHRDGPDGAARGARDRRQVDRVPVGSGHQRGAISGRYQVGNGGNFPFTSLVDRKIPVKAIGIVSPNLLHALVVPSDSPLKSIKDLKGSNPPATIGLVTGSSAEFYFQMAIQLNGLQVGKDIILKNMPPGEQIAMPRAWPEWSRGSHARADRVRAQDRPDRRHDLPVQHVRGPVLPPSEIIENVPDVAQAFADALAEATLWTRRNPEKTAELMAEDPNLRHFSKPSFCADPGLQQPVQADLPVPACAVLGQANEPIFDWLFAQKRITRP